MKPINNYENVQATTGEFNKLPAGGYICRITLADDVPMDDKTGKGDYIKIEFDIAHGEYKNYFEKQYERFSSFWGGSFIRSYKEKALGMFKHFTNCIEECNAGYMWAWDEKTLQGKYVGLVIGYEEYVNGSGETKERLYVKDVKTVEQIKQGDFKVPELKKLSIEVPNKIAQFATFVSSEDDDSLPF